MTEQNLNVTYPTINLFLYDIQQGLGQDEDVIFDNRMKFWRKIDPQFHQDIKEIEKYREIEKSPTKLSETEQQRLKQLLLQAELKLIKEIAKKEENQNRIEARNLEKLDGFLDAKIIGDTYALQVNISGKKEPQNIEEVSEIYQQILTQINHQSQGSLGQTWFIWAKLEKEDQALEVAKKCAEQINPNLKEIEPITSNTWLNASINASIFEYPQIPTEWYIKEWQDFNKQNQHLIICLFHPEADKIEELSKKISKNYQKLQQLFLSRHKIIWAYWQSQIQKQQLKEQYTKIKGLTNKRNDIYQQLKTNTLNLKSLQLDLTNALKHLSDFTIGLNLLNAQAHTIKINRQNYQKLSPQNALTFISYAKQYQTQIETDYASLSTKLPLLENFIRTLEGINQIQQTKNEQNLTLVIGATGAGLAASGITATLMSAKIAPPPSPQPNTKEAYSFSLPDAFTISFLAFFLFGIGVFLGWKLLSTLKTPKNPS